MVSNSKIASLIKSLDLKVTPDVILQVQNILDSIGGTQSRTVTQTLNSGSNDVSHDLGTEPSTWTIQDSTGRTLTYAALPKSGSETTVLQVTALIETTNAKITVFS